MKQSGFNPQARWDRHIPETSDGSEHPAQFPQRIEVLAWFRNAKITPRLFIWNNKTYKIRNVTYRWQERRGQELINFFSVSTGADLYQISFSAIVYSWRLEKIIEG